MTTRRFYVAPEYFGDSIRLDEKQSHHLLRVLRLDRGENVRVFDGNGRESVYSVSGTVGKQVLLQFVERAHPPSPESELQITLASALLKSSNSELVLQKAVELGVTRIVPLITSRTEASRGSWKRERVFRIACESAKQCGRATVPEILEISEFKTFVESMESPAWLFSENTGVGLPDALPSREICLIVGPEGGWDSGEIEEARAHGIEIIHLGGRILRAETASIVATTIVQHRFGDLA